MFESMKKRREKEKFKEENKEQKQFASENRKTGEKVAAALESARSSSAGIADARKQHNYREALTYLANKMRYCESNAFCNTSEIDEKMKMIADELAKALKFGDQKAADAIIERVKDLIEEREKLASCLKEDVEDEMEKVEKMATGTLTLINYYDSLRESKNNRKISSEKLDNSKKKYKEQYVATQAMEKKDPKAAEELETFIPGKDELSPSAKEIAKARKDLKADYMSQETARISKETAEAYINALERYIDDLDLILKQRNSRLNKETIEQTKTILNEYVNNLKGIKDDVAQLTELSEYFASAINAVDNDSRDEQYYMEVTDWYHKMVAQEKMHEESLAEGRRLAAERENQRANENRMMNEN